MGWAVKLASNTPFRGREALERQKREGVTKMLAGFSVDDPDIVLIGRETIYRNGEIAGWLTSGGFGYTVNKAIGYGYVRSGSGVDREYVLNGSYKLEVATERIPARVHMTALHDPAMIRLKA